MSDTINDRTSPTLSNSWAVLTDQVATEEAEGNKPVTDLHRGSTENVVALGDDVPPTASALGHDPAFSDHQRCNNPECIEWAIIQKRRLNAIWQRINEELIRSNLANLLDRNNLIHHKLKQIPSAVDRWMIWGKMVEESLAAGGGPTPYGMSAGNQKFRKQHYHSGKPKTAQISKDTHALRRESIMKLKRDEKRRSEAYDKYTNVLHNGDTSNFNSSGPQKRLPLQPREQDKARAPIERVSKVYKRAPVTNNMLPHLSLMDFAVPDNWELRVSNIHGYPYWLADDGSFSATPPADIVFRRQRCLIELPHGWEMYRRRMSGHAETPVFVNHKDMIMQYQWPGLVAPLESMIPNIDQTRPLPRDLPPVVDLVEGKGEDSKVRRWLMSGSGK